MDLDAPYIGEVISENQVQQLVVKCSPSIPESLMSSLIRRESNYKPYAIGMDSGYGYVTQPTSLEEAKKTVTMLRNQGRKFSIGLTQIHISNIDRYKLNLDQAFQPCINMHTSELIFKEFKSKAESYGYKGNDALFAALRGYNSGGINYSVSNDYATDIMQKARYDISRLLVKNINVSNLRVANSKDDSKDKVISEGVENEEIKVSGIFGKKDGRQNDFFANGFNRQDDFFVSNE